jgi:hypothetical protein
LGNQLDTFLSSYSREAREIALCLRTLVLNVFPEATERVDPRAGIIAYSRGKASKEWVFAIAPYMKHVNLLFSKGAHIPDPSKLLVGSGEQTRHVKIKSEAETQNSTLRLLLEEALKLGFGKDT